MNTKRYLVLSAILGGVIGSLLTSLLVSPVTAQRDKFGHIECTSLAIVDADGDAQVIIGKSEYGGVVAVNGKDRESTASLTIHEHGGQVAVAGKDGKMYGALAIIEHGGYIQVYGKGEGAAAMGINEYGNGAVSTWDKNGYRQ